MLLRIYDYSNVRFEVASLFFGNFLKTSISLKRINARDESIQPHAVLTYTKTQQMTERRAKTHGDLAVDHIGLPADSLTRCQAERQMADHPVGRQHRVLDRSHR